MNFFLLFTFWLGVFLLIPYKKQHDLKTRAYKFLGRSFELSKKSKLYMAFNNYKLRRERNLVLRELIESLMYIKNLAVLGRAQSLSSELLLTELSDFSIRLKQTYLDMAHYLHTNKKSEAVLALQRAAGDSYGRGVGNMLSTWEDIDPVNMVSTVDLYISALEEERTTYIKKRNELISDLVYFPVVINCMIVLLDFVYVAYFIQQQQLLNILF